MKKILFVCTGNVFRSMIAEKCFKKYIADNWLGEKFDVNSAWIAPIKQNVQKDVIDRLGYYWIDYNNHKYKKNRWKLVNESSYIIAMSFNHKDFIKNEFNLDVSLFNELAYSKSTWISDFWEFLDFWWFNLKDINLNDPKYKKEVRNYIYYTVDYINNSIPFLIKSLK